jgi:thiol-disulfide isomerase/thioredoxin
MRPGFGASAARKPALGLAGTALLMLIVGCTASSSDGVQAPTSGPRYSTGDAVAQFAPSDRGEPVPFRGTTGSADVFQSSDLAGSVLVVNFWYAACGPCRAEAPDLAALSTRLSDDGVAFVGVNVRDQAATAAAFDAKFGIPYPSLLDADSGDVQLAFAGQVPANAVPTTLVLDRRGRIASRVIGQLDPAVLESLIADAVQEDS